MSERPSARSEPGARSSHGRRRLPLWVAGATILAAWLAFAARDPGQGTFAFFLYLGFASAGYALAMLEIALRRYPSSAVLAAFVLLAFAWRVPLVLAPAYPGADVTRYVWDARLVRAGLSPYSIAPASLAVAHLRTAESWPVNNPEVPSPYSPGAQAFFLLATVWSESVLAVKVALLACEALLALALWRWLLAIGSSPAWVLAYLWNPLVVFEVARQGHADVLGALFVVLSALALSRRRTSAGCVALALAVSVKPLPLVLAPLLWRRASLRNIGYAAGVLVVLYGSFWIRGGPPVGSIPEVVRRFRFNGPAFEAVATGSTPLLATALAVVAGLVVAAVVRTRLPATSAAAWAWPVATTLLFAPLVYPWYLVWLAPFLFTRATLPLLAWTISIQLVYVTWRLPPGAAWVVPRWALAVEYGVLLAVGAWAGRKARRGRLLGEITPAAGAP